MAGPYKYSLVPVGNFTGAFRFSSNEEVFWEGPDVFPTGPRSLPRFEVKRPGTAPPPTAPNETGGRQSRDLG